MWAWHKLHSKRLLHFAALHTLAPVIYASATWKASLEIMLTPVLY